MTQTGWTDEAEVNFDDVPDEMVNLPDAVYVFDIAKVTPKKTKAGVQALEVVLKAASVHGSSLNVVSDIPKGAKGLYETVQMAGDNLLTAKNLLKAAGLDLPRKINYEVLCGVAEALMDRKQIIAKVTLKPAANGYAARSQVARYYSEESLAAALSSGSDTAVANDAPVAATPRGRRRGAEAAAA